MNTLISEPRLRVIRKLLSLSQHLSGVALEVGVYQGGSLEIIASELCHKAVYGFDTFEGLPAKDWKEGEVHQPGEFAETSQSELNEQFLAAGIENVRLVKGYFPESADTLGLQSICFAHIDVDFEEAIRNSLHFIWPRLVPGGFVVIDDYDWPRCPGVKPVVDQFAKERGLNVTMAAHYQAWLQQPLASSK